MVEVSYSLVGANGDTIALDGVDYVLNPGFTGFGLPPAEVRIAPSAADGGIWRHSKRGIRDIDLPITVLGSDRADVEEKLRRLGRLTQDLLGATELLATYSDGKELRLFIHYVGGAEGSWGNDEGRTWAKWVLSFQAPIPFWISTLTDGFIVKAGGTGRGLLPQLTKLKVSSSSALGSNTITNTGDVKTYPLWRIDGPITNLAISSTTSPGFTFTTAVTAGQTIFVDTELGRVYDSAGVNRYSYLGASPKLFAIDPGVNTVTISGTDTSTATQIACTYALRYEVVH